MDGGKWGKRSVADRFDGSDKAVKSRKDHFILQLYSLDVSYQRSRIPPGPCGMDYNPEPYVLTPRLLLTEDSFSLVGDRSCLSVLSDQPTSHMSISSYSSIIYFRGWPLVVQKAIHPINYTKLSKIPGNFRQPDFGRSLSRFYKWPTIPSWGMDFFKRNCLSLLAFLERRRQVLERCFQVFFPFCFVREFLQYREERILK